MRNPHQKGLKPHPCWIQFEGDTKPVRTDQLTLRQEMFLERGRPFSYVAPPKAVTDDVVDTPAQKKRKVTYWTPDAASQKRRCSAGQNLKLKWLHNQLLIGLLCISLASQKI